MEETPQQYTERILSYQRDSQPMKILAATPKRLEKLVGRKSKQKLARRPQPEQWSVAEILAHLADSELVIGFRIRLILGSNAVPIHAFDQDVWADCSGYRRQDPWLSLEAFRVQRERNLRLLRGLPKEMWENYGMHSERGKETITRIAEMTAGHDINHVRQIESLLSPTRRSPRLQRKS